MGPAREVATSLGMPELRMIELPYPLHSLTQKSAREIGAASGHAVAASLTSEAVLNHDDLDRSPMSASARSGIPQDECEDDMCYQC